MRRDHAFKLGVPVDLVLVGLLRSTAHASHAAQLRSLAVKPFTTLAVALFALIAVAHLFRLFAGWEVIVAGFVIPVWFSWLGLIIAGGLAVMVWREARTRM